MKKDYNILAHHGTTDQEYVEEFDLDPSVANTPKIHKAMIDKMYEENLIGEAEAYVEDGDDEETAKKKAIVVAGKLRADAWARVKYITDTRGY